MRVTVVVPLLNEEDSLEQLYEGISEALGSRGLVWDVVFIDDGSTDSSMSVLRKLFTEKDNVEVLFSDNGCGMSLDVRRRAFDPFFTTRRDQGGTGLGLHIVYSIVTNRLGGRLDLDSEPGGGTRIQIILPRVAPLEQAAE